MPTASEKEIQDSKRRLHQERTYSKAFLNLQDAPWRPYHLYLLGIGFFSSKEQTLKSLASCVSSAMR
ncbi:unnamed protein product [Blepharisma stoltei]|uniref:Uncharacterized protein n=1 Tax=Blepharisma stoltei TaxID=1481888 RepID=A0AAU9ICW1_9CILI|nr:unnamed protein product [Blepharisma stoltei]